MARQDNQQANDNRNTGKDSDLERKSAGGRSGTPGDYSDPNARSGQGRSGGNQIANEDDDDDDTYGRQAYQRDAGGGSQQGSSRQQGGNQQGRGGQGRSSQRDDE